MAHTDGLVQQLQLHQETGADRRDQEGDPQIAEDLLPARLLRAAEDGRGTRIQRVVSEVLQESRD